MKGLSSQLLPTVMEGLYAIIFQSFAFYATLFSTRDLKAVIPHCDLTPLNQYDHGPCCLSLKMPSDCSHKGKQQATFSVLIFSKWLPLSSNLCAAKTDISRPSMATHVKVYLTHVLLWLPRTHMLSHACPEITATASFSHWHHRPAAGGTASCRSLSCAAHNFRRNYRTGKTHDKTAAEILHVFWSV